MKRKKHSKHLLIFGFILLIAVILPILFPSNTTIIAQASDISNQNKVKLNVSSKTLVVDDTYKLKVYNCEKKYKIAYKSESNSTVSVNKNGIITGNKVGDSTIKVTVKSGMRIIDVLYCDVTVGPPAVSVKFTKDIRIDVDECLTLDPVIKPKNTAETPCFSSGDTDVVQISSSGKITGVSSGSTYVYASIGSGDTYQYDYCRVDVSN